MSPLSRLLLAAASGTLESEPAPEFSAEAAVTVVLASEGYPEQPLTGRPLTGTDAAASVDGVHLAHAATKNTDGGLVATGGRVLNVVALGADLADARGRAYAALEHISLEGAHYRRDIALSASQ